MRFSNNGTTYSAEENYGSTKAWTLTTGSGTKTVWAQFKNVAGAWSPEYSDTILLDMTVPTTTATPPGGTYSGPQSVTLSCSDGTGSGCDKIYYTTDGSPPTLASALYTGGTITIDASSSPMHLKYFSTDLDTDRSDFETAQEVAIAKARADILKSHRGTTVTFQTVFRPEIDLSHIVHLDCAWVEAQGKVRRVTHRWDQDTGSCTSEIAIALYRHNGLAW